MNSRPFEEQDLAVVAEWFSGIEWTIPGVEGVLPKIGILVEESEVPLACGWLYTTDTTLAILAWTATNPEVAETLQSAALDKLIESVQHAITMQSGKIKMLMVLSKSGAFTAKLKGLGFRAKGGFDQATWILKD